MRQLLVLIAMLAIVPTAHAWSWPTDGRVLAPFAFDPGNPYAAGQHRGIDVAGGPAAPVRAPAAGVVSFAGTVPGSGKSITIDTADGWSVTLTHLGQLGVRKDAAVAEGDPVGALADGGAAEEPYVQLGIRRTADPQGYVDPLAFLPAHESPVPAAPAVAPAGDAAPVPAGAAAPAAPVVAAAPLPAEAPPSATAAPPVAVSVSPAADEAPAVAPPPAPVALDPQAAPASASAAAAVAAAPVPAQAPTPVPAPPAPAPAVGPPEAQPTPSTPAPAPPPRAALAAVPHVRPLVSEPSRPPDALARPDAGAARPPAAPDARRSSAPEPTRAPARPQVADRHPSTGRGFEVFRFAPAVVAALVATLVGVLLAVRRATTKPAAEPAAAGLA